MTDKTFTYDDHSETLNRLIATVKTAILPYKDLLLDFVALKTDLKDFDINNLEKLPAVKWKIKNLEKLQKNNPEKFKEQYTKLVEYFN